MSFRGLVSTNNMKTRSISIILCCLIFAPITANAQPQIITSAQVNGTWTSNSGTFKILALGKQRLQVEYSGVYRYKMADGSPMANMGAGSGIATIAGRTANFKPEGAEAACAITMNFSGDGLKVEQQSNCGFGLNVTATGRYRKVIAGKPTFKITNGRYWLGGTDQGLEVAGDRYRYDTEGGEQPWQNISNLKYVKDGVIFDGKTYWCLSTLAPNPITSCGADGWSR
jgi:hypothetical protein